MAERILCCGGRMFDDRAGLFKFMDSLRGRLDIECIIHGAQRRWDPDKKRFIGADYLFGCWADAQGLPVLAFPAQWEVYGKSAGTMRNARMLREGRPTMGVAMPGGPGTEDMCRRMQRAGLRMLRPGLMVSQAELDLALEKP